MSKNKEQPITENELTQPLEWVHPRDVVRCVEQFKDIDTDKLMTMKYTFMLANSESLYNVRVMALAIDEVVKSRLTKSIS